LPRTLDAVHAAIRSGHVLACHDISEGGLLATLFEMGIGGDRGADVDLSAVAQLAANAAARPDRVSSGEITPDRLLFNETAGVFVMELDDGGAADTLLSAVPHVVLGRTVPEQELRVAMAGRPLFAVAMSDLQEAWERPMREVFH
jgi:phosphoribosylformylglycinamidine synthase